MFFGYLFFHKTNIPYFDVFTLLGSFKIYRIPIIIIIIFLLFIIIIIIIIFFKI